MDSEPTGTLPSVSGGKLRSVRRLTQRKFRLETGQFLAEGPQAVREALAFGHAVELFVRTGDDSPRIAELIRAASAARVPVYATSASDLDRLSDTVHPQGVVAVCTWPEATLPVAPKLVVVCAQIRDPGNAGTVIRCADAFGADAVILTSDSVEVTNPKVVRASVGSIFHLPVLTGIALADAVQDLRDRGLQVLAADGSGSDRLDMMTAELARPTAWVMGNEAWGLPSEHAELADRRVGVPIWGHAESLNLATAAAVCLYATASAQRA